MYLGNGNLRGEFSGFEFSGSRFVITRIRKTEHGNGLSLKIITVETENNCQLYFRDTHKYNALADLRRLHFKSYLVSYLGGGYTSWFPAGIHVNDQELGPLNPPPL